MSDNSRSEFGAPRAEAEERAAAFEEFAVGLPGKKRIDSKSLFIASHWQMGEGITNTVERDYYSQGTGGVFQPGVRTELYKEKKDRRYGFSSLCIFMESDFRPASWSGHYIGGRKGDWSIRYRRGDSGSQNNASDTEISAGSLVEIKDVLKSDGEEDEIISTEGSEVLIRYTGNDAKLLPRCFVFDSETDTREDILELLPDGIFSQEANQVAALKELLEGGSLCFRAKAQR